MSALLSKSSGVLVAVLFFISILIGQSHAHEIRPAIADVTIEGNQLTLEVDVNLEAFIAGVHLSAYQDTNESEFAQVYDALRAVPAAEIKAAFEDFWPQMQADITILAGETALQPSLESVSVIEEPDFELLRDATILLSAELPDDGTPVVVGWDAKFGPLVVRQMGLGEQSYTVFLRNGEISDPMARSGQSNQTFWQVFTHYIVVGFEHILPLGLDHILFVLGLFFLSPKLKPLLFQVTAFTIAHTVTLALGILGLVNVSPEIVEPLIAASIVYVAIENIFSYEMKPWRLAIVFAFGLLHGLGFASVLGEFGLDSSRFITGLIGFNIGVELGQLTVIALAFFVVGLWFSHKPWYRSYVSNPASILIGLIGAYWFIERVFL